MSEYLGKEMVNLDSYFLKLGLNEVAKSNYLSLPEEDRQELQHYSSGVNECVRNRKSLPWEMSLLNIKFEEWTGEDTMSQIKLISFFLAFDYKYEALREQIASKVGEVKAR